MGTEEKAKHAEDRYGLLWAELGRKVKGNPELGKRLEALNGACKKINRF